MADYGIAPPSQIARSHYNGQENLIVRGEFQQMAKTCQNAALLHERITPTFPGCCVHSRDSKMLSRPTRFLCLGDYNLRAVRRTILKMQQYTSVVWHQVHCWRNKKTLWVLASVLSEYLSWSINITLYEHRPQIAWKGISDFLQSVSNRFTRYIYFHRYISWQETKPKYRYKIITKQKYKLYKNDTANPDPYTHQMTPPMTPSVTAPS